MKEKGYSQRRVCGPLNTDPRLPIRQQRAYSLVKP